MTDPLVSMFESATSAKVRNCKLSTVLGAIKGGAYATRILALRELKKSDPDAYNLKKKELPAFTVSGTAKSRKEPLEHSALIQGDIDHLNGHNEIVREYLKQDPHVRFVFISPGGDGIKFGIVVDPSDHTQAFLAAQAYFKVTYNLSIDPSVKDRLRLCFVSHDPDLWINPAATPVPPLPKKPVAPPRASATTPSGSRSRVAESVLGAITWESEVYGFCQCPGQHLHTTPTNPKDCDVRLEGAPTIHCFHGSCANIVNGVNKELRSLIGKAEYVPPDLHGHDQPHPESQGGEFEQAAPATPPKTIEELLVGTEFDILSPPPAQTTVFETTAGISIATRANISALTAQAKAGKSAFVAALAAAAITPNQEKCDLLGIKSVNPERLPILILDTEHSPNDHHTLCERILRRAGLTKSDRLLSRRLSGFSVRQLNEALEYLLNQRPYLAVFLDGTGDFVADVNDPKESNAFVAHLHGLAIHFNTHILNVLHLNPSSDSKSRGHLGSQLERKSETNLRIEKTDEISVVFADKNRGAAILKSKGPRFSWSTEHHMHTSLNPLGSVKSQESLALLSEQASEAFRISNKTALYWKELVSALLSTPGIRSERSAERAVSDLKSNLLIQKNILGQWELSVPK